MNLLLLRSEQLEASGMYCIEDRVLEHLRTIKKVKVGDRLDAGRIDEDRGDFQVQEESSDLIRGIYLPQERPKKVLELDLFLSYQRPQTMKKILFLAGTVGITRIYLFPLFKTEKSYIQSNLWKEGRWLQELYLGMEQGKNIYLPKLFHMESKKKLVPFFQEKHLYVLDPIGNWFQTFPGKDDLPQSVQFVLGPEGGLTKEDLEFFHSYGAEVRKVSDHILRSEHALAYLLAQLEILKEMKI